MCDRAGCRPRAAGATTEIEWGPACFAHERPPAGAVDPEVAADRGREWVHLLGDDRIAFGQAMDVLGVDDDTFTRLLGAVPTSTGAPPPWVRTADLMRTAGAGQDPEPERHGLLTVAMDLVHGARRELTDRLSAMRADARPPLGLTRLAETLDATWPGDELARALGRTMVLELNVARIQGRLHGADSHQRFASFARMLAEPAVRSQIWSEYPVLLRYCVELLQKWVASCLEFAGRLVADLPVLPGGPLGDLTNVRFGAGDRHRGGRTVAIVSFTGGTVVYKPRSLLAEETWARVVAWFNDHEPRHPLTTAPVLDRGEYGWAGFVTGTACASDREVRAFYWRIGALTALLHALDGADVHAENLIACGAQPVLIDLEALLHGPGPAAEEASDDPAADLMNSGVTRIGLLPARRVVRAEGRAGSYEIGAVGTGGRQVSPIPLPVADEPGTDRMRVVNRHLEIGSLDAGRASLGTGVADPLPYRGEVVDGFSRTYRAILADRACWLTELLPSFAGVASRYLLQPTTFYARLLSDSLHPDFLRDALDRERSLIRLVGHGGDPAATPAAVPAAELSDLRGGDIPRFECRPGSRDLWTSTGERVADFLAVTPMAAARARVAGLGEPDLAVQTGLIHQAFDSLHAASRRRSPPAPLPRARSPLGDADVHRIVEEVALDLCRKAIRGPGGLGWLSVNFVDESVWQLNAAPPTLYDGGCGIGLLLSTVVSRDDRDPEIAEAAAVVADSTMRRALETAERLERRDLRGALSRRAIERAPNPGLFGETAGALYYLTHAGVLHGRADLLDAAAACVPVLRTHLGHGAVFDLGGGCAGAILGLLALHAVRPSRETLAVAEVAADRILRGAVRPAGDPDVVGWPTPWGGTPLTGMSHGAAGIAYALGRLHAVAPRPELLAAIGGALRYERSQFDVATGAWRDLRESAPAGTPLLAWCHGAPGIGLSRLGLLREPASGHPHDLAAEDLRLAVRHTEAAMFARDGRHFVTTGCQGLCHGDLGNLELLALAADPGSADTGSGSRPGSNPARTGRVAAAVRAIRDHGERAGWHTGAAGAGAAPGLMYGMAGIGYQLLRLSDLDRTPSVLLFEPPRIDRTDQPQHS